MAQTKKKIAPDWERIEADYRAGLLSVREIAASQGVSHTAVQKRAKTQGWERDLKAKIKAKADSLVAKREVASSVATDKTITERQLVDANAQVIADVRIRQRCDITRAQRLAMQLLGELEAQTENTDLVSQFAQALATIQESSDGMMRAFDRVISTSGRIDSMKKLAEAMRVLVGLEREAYGLEDAPEAPPPAPSIDYGKLSKEALREIVAAADGSPST